MIFSPLFWNEENSLDREGFPTMLKSETAVYIGIIQRVEESPPAWNVGFRPSQTAQTIQLVTVDEGMARRLSASGGCEAQVSVRLDRNADGDITRRELLKIYSIYGVGKGFYPLDGDNGGPGGGRKLPSGNTWTGD
jgi:hypothetical protein